MIIYLFKKQRSTLKTRKLESQSQQAMQQMCFSFIHVYLCQLVILTEIQSSASFFPAVCFRPPCGQQQYLLCLSSPLFPHCFSSEYFIFIFNITDLACASEWQYHCHEVLHLKWVFFNLGSFVQHQPLKVVARSHKLESYNHLRNLFRANFENATLL